MKRTEVLAWIEAEWVRPETDAAGHHFRPVDVARLRLIRELRQDLAIGPEAMPVVLSLVDEMYTLRRRLAALARAVAEAPDEVRVQVRTKCRTDSDRRSIRKNVRRRRDDRRFDWRVCGETCKNTSDNS